MLVHQHQRPKIKDPRRQQEQLRRRVRCVLDPQRFRDELEAEDGDDEENGQEDEGGDGEPDTST